MLPSSIAYDSIILASVVISADAAIFDYENGIIRDEENDLRVLRQAICQGESDRLKPILSDACKYTSDIGKWEKTGSAEIIDLFKYIHDSREIPYVSHIGTIAGNANDNVELEYLPGKRVLVLENEGGKFESLMILDYDDEGQVCRIKVADAENYKFSVDEKYEKIEIPLDIENMIKTAKEGRKNMTLYRITEEVMDIEEGLMYGTIHFTYDRLMSAMKPGHPMEILDSIIAEIFWDVRAGKEPELESVKNVISNLKDFKKCFKVKELGKVIKHLEAYVEDTQKENIILKYNLSSIDLDKATRMDGGIELPYEMSAKRNEREEI